MRIPSQEKMTSIPAVHLSIAGESPSMINEGLDSAMNMAQMQVMNDGAHGILVTRQRYGAFTVEVSADARYGVVRESCEICLEGRDRHERKS
jgi:hypothetical protein